MVEVINKGPNGVLVTSCSWCQSDLRYNPATDVENINDVLYYITCPVCHSAITVPDPNRKKACNES